MILELGKSLVLKPKFEHLESRQVINGHGQGLYRKWSAIKGFWILLIVSYSSDLRKDKLGTEHFRMHFNVNTSS